MIEVRVTDVFVRASKRLLKMYVSFKDDYLRLVADLESNTVHAIVKNIPVFWVTDGRASLLVAVSGQPRRVSYSDLYSKS